MSKKNNNPSKNRSAGRSNKSQDNLQNNLSGYKTYAVAKLTMVAHEVSSFALGMLPFTLCVYSAIFLVHTYDLPLPPIAFAMPLAVLLLFLLKPQLEKAAGQKRALSFFWQYLDNAIEKTADRLLLVMPLCFVPIGVGIVKDTSILLDAWFLLFLVIVPHTILSISLTMILLKALDSSKTSGLKKNQKKGGAVKSNVARTNVARSNVARARS